ncbi:magnesium transporter CorA family protein [Paenibacillus sp. GCM10027626]|uniref:magnesium transporter CorA family protein n=1 Tax=Paenibacillus sp. GCM10027626 TaxID=3273411 RepID=UPI0036434A72
MLTIYSNDAAGKLQTTAEMAHNTLIYLVAPTNTEIARTAQTLAIPEHLLRDPLDAGERPRIEKDGEGMLMVLHVPVAAASENRLYEEVPYRTMPIGIIHAKDHLVIVAKEEVPLLADMIAGHYGSYGTNMKTRITLLLFAAVAKAYTDFVKRISGQVASLQQQLKKAHRNQELFGLIHLNKSLVYFATSLRAMCHMFKRIAKGHDIKLYEEDERMLQDALVDLEQAAEVTEMRSNSLSSLMDAYAAVVHNNLNSVLKILTTLTIILVIPTMMGSIFSMNVALPYENEWMTTVVVSGLIVAMCSGLIYVFYKTRFLRF